MARVMTVAVLALGSLALLAAPASAQGDTTDGRDQIVFNGRLDVPAGTTVGTAVIFHGPATVEGTVTGALVVFDGRVDISGTVDGDVVVFNGKATVRSGAHIGGNLVTTDSPTVEQGATIEGQQRGISGGWDTANLGLASRFAWWVGYSISTLVLGMVLLLFGPALDAAIVRALRRRTGGAIGFGALAFFLLPVVAVLLMVIVVALPLGLFLLLALAFLYTVGYVAAGIGVGRLIVKPPTSRYLSFLAGWGILRVIALVPVLGGTVWALAALFGLGLLWVAARSSETAPAMADGSVPPPPPVPSQG
ncbi:MAG: hypothetical protein ACM3OO_03540 [Planctomycetaceae bacterium]